MRLIPLAALLPLLVACATPQQACLTSVTKDLRVVEGLMAQTEQNLARGYALETTPAVQTGLDLCINPDDPFLFCDSQTLTVTEKPVAIDAQAEQAKLASLRAKRQELANRAQMQAADCRARYPQ